MIRRQVLASLSSLLGTTCTGMTNAFTSTLLPQIHQFMDDEMQSWLASTNVLSQLVGIIVGSYLMRKYGRKPFIMWLNIPWLIGWICLSLANTLWIFFIGCLIVGSISGFYGSLSAIYLVEMPEPHFRGLFAALNAVCYTSGILLQNTIGVLFMWQTALKVTIIVPVLSFFLAIYTPESPNWLILHNYTDKAKEIFFWLRTANDANEEEFAGLLGSTAENEEPAGRCSTRHMFSKQFFTSLFIASFTVTTDIVAGFDSITTYSVDMIKDMSQNLNAQCVTILASLFAVVSCSVSCTFIDKMPRRLLFFMSGLGVLMSLLAIICILLFNLPQYLIVVFLCTYQAAGNVGIITIPWLLAGEIFPDVVREAGNALCNVCYFILEFIFIKMNLFLIATIGIEMLFVTYAVLLLIWLIILYLFMPETKGHILQQVEFRIDRNE